MSKRMPLEQQVASLEPSKKLKALGVKQESKFYWWWGTWECSCKDQKDHAILKDHQPNNPKGGWKFCSAFTVAELGEKLRGIGVGFYCLSDEYACDFRMIDETIERRSKTEADARAKMLAHLIEIGVVKP